MREKTALEVQGMTAGYGGAPIIQDVNLRVDAGTITAIVGPNGAGKSTLLKGLAGLIKISSGTARIKAQTITSLRTERLASLGVAYVPQVANIFPGMTVRENWKSGDTGAALAWGRASTRSVICSLISGRLFDGRPARSAEANAACWRWPAAS